jgi:hypothetical protein
MRYRIDNSTGKCNDAGALRHVPIDVPEEVFGSGVVR